MDTRLPGWRIAPGRYRVALAATPPTAPWSARDAGRIDDEALTACRSTSDAQGAYRRDALAAFPVRPASGVVPDRVRARLCGGVIAYLPLLSLLLPLKVGAVAARRGWTC